MAKGERLAAFETAFGHRFRNRQLLERALTHRSASSAGAAVANNEQLEFLGDRVLGLVAAELVLEAFPEASEGQLARRFNELVRRQACAEIAKDMGLPPHLKLSSAEVSSGGRTKDTILADACEALLGAVFLDGGFEATRSIVRRYWQSRLPAIATSGPDAKTALQEWAQGKGLPLPSYQEVARKGPAHAPQFTTEVKIDGMKPARGEGANKRQAEQAAARTILEREGIWGREP